MRFGLASMLLAFSFLSFSQPERKIMERTTYFDSAMQVRTIDYFSEDGFLIQRKKYDYSHFPSASVNPNQPPGPPPLKYVIKYAYDSLGRVVSEISKNFWYGNFAWIYSDSGRKILKQSYSELENKWKNRDRWTLNSRGDTILHEYFSTDSLSNSVERCDFTYTEYGVDARVFYSKNRWDSKKWRFERREKYFYGPGNFVDSIITTREDGTLIKRKLIFYIGDKPVKENTIGNNYLEERSKSYDRKGRLVQTEIKIFKDNILTENRKSYVFYNRFGLPVKEYTEGQHWTFRVYHYEYY